MKIKCIDHDGSKHDTFICKINQHTILLNCPVETFTLTQNDEQQPQEQDQDQQRPIDLNSMLSSFSTLGKRINDTQYSSLNNNIKNCDYPTVFRVADFSLIDIDSIDLVLISNSHLMLGLPYLTEYMGYKGKIIATEPTIEYAKQRMEELVIYHGQNVSTTEPTLSTHFSKIGDMFNVAIPEGWRSIYTYKDVISCIEKIQPVRYTETLSLFSTLDVVAHSSGYSLGSSNWLIETSFKKIAFISTSSLYSVLHPAPFDFDIVKKADVVVVGGLSTQAQSELSFERARTKLLAQIGRTLQSQHNVILVASSMGLIFDLIGDIDNYFRSIGKEIGPERHQTPIYVVNPIADQSLKYANICGEWMNAGRHDLLYVPELPLSHGQFMRTGALQTITNLEATEAKVIREPCIVFTGDPTCMSKGSLPWFLKRWGNQSSSSLNACIFIDQDSPLQVQPDVIPATGCKINFTRLPLDTRLKLENIPTILHTYWQNKENKRHLLIPNTKGAELVKEEEEQGQDTKVYIYEQGELLDINVNRDWERVSVSEKLAKNIDPAMVPNNQQTNEDVMWAPIHGSLNYYNNRLEIHPNIYVNDDQSLVLDHQSELRVNTELNSMIKRFEENSIPIQIKKDAHGITTIELPSDMNARIIMNGSSTTVVASDDAIRKLLRNITVTNMRDL